MLGRSLRARLALFAGVTMAVLCVATSALLLRAAHTVVVEIRRNEVIGGALRVVHLIKDHELPPTIDVAAHSVQVVDGGGRVVSSTPNLAGAPRLTTAAPGPGAAHHNAVLCGLPGLSGACQIMAAFRVNEPEGDWIIYTFGPLPAWYVDPGVLALLTGACAGLVCLAWFGVSRVVARTLAPVRSITEKLSEITAGNGTMRVPVPDGADEIKGLAETANRTLARLEGAMEQQRRFASDASHDLRSPITAMRAELDGAMLAPAETDWPETCEKLTSSLDRLQNIVTDLLTLAKLDAGAPARLEAVDLADLVCAETARPRSKKVVTSLDHGVSVTGDRLRLARLLTNLLDNAERHAESRITVSVRRAGGEAVLEVCDDGAGIAPEHRETVFQRFTRLDASRSRDAGGTGLGLPIAREIAWSHSGTLTIEDSERGARFVARMPVRDH
ncbi:HAMP domain-containing sensor histidine kinase [Nonomuraea sp. NPDC046802]|uniref:HAMP domain-containing sensor histidine kinase n=1 Tax=Nonomuraea sp. NPDC046802 TaxID=3154919 RepID=UPI0033D8D38E